MSEAMESQPQSRPSPVQAAPPAKRARVALACERCKSRKQKCDGKHPSCSKCHRLSIKCEYIIPSKPMPFGRNHYVASLEKRVTELEDFLARKGLLDQVSSFTPFNISGPPSVSEDAGLHRPEAESYMDAVSRTRASSHSDPDVENGDSMVRILRDLSLESNGGYIGATSHFTMGRLVSSIVQGKHHNLRGSQSPSQQSHDLDLDESVELRLSDVPPSVANKLFSGYLKHVATRYPVLQSTWIHDLHNRRDRISNAYERSTLHLVYAIAGRFLETTGETNNNFLPERHQAEVLKDLDEMLRYHDTRSVVTLLLLAVYSLRAEGGPGAWAYIGLAMRIAIDLGLHRQTSTMDKLGFDVEMRKRLFWSCYTMDRQISIPLGRPFSISDHDIDVALPLDVDESCQDIRVLEHASKLDPHCPRNESTSLTAFLHILQLRRIESSIQQTIYRVDQAIDITDAEVDRYLEQLERWRGMIPLDAKTHVDRESVAFDGYDYYMVFYWKCKRLLLYPLISKPRSNPRYLQACAKVCGGVAQTYKRLHQTLSVGYSLMALQTVFMAGLTLIYCAWMSPEEIFSSGVSNDINACSIVLFVITERWPAAKKYRDAFEAVKQIVIDPLSDSQNHAPQRAITMLPSVELPLDEGRQEYTSIVTRMAGQQMQGVVSYGQPEVIGMEQVQYQMGDGSKVVHASQQTFGDDLEPYSRSAFGSMGSIAGNYESSGQVAGGNNGETYHDLSSWPPNGMDGALEFPADSATFDLEGFSVDMGWMADSFGSTMR